MGTINPAYEILEGSALRDMAFMCKTQNHLARERVLSTHILILVLCVYLSVCPMRDLGNGRLYRCTSYIDVKSFA